MASFVAMAGAAAVVAVNGSTWFPGDGAPVATLSVAPDASMFPIGVWVPPVESFRTWIDRGINTVVGVPQDRD
ncbi:MAG: hypothetical protein ACRD0Q_05795, partial [Acidimicrobiales bacterium]